MTNKNKLIELRDYYRCLLKMIDKEKEILTEGFLGISSYGKRIQYYHHYKDAESGKWKKVYLRKNDYSLAKNLAQKSYNKKLKKLVYKRLYFLERACANYQDDEIDRLFTGMRNHRQKLVTPIVLPKEELIKNWLDQVPKADPPDYPDNGLFSKNGEKVRSKSEKILADMFYDQKIPYKYEFPLYIDRQYRYPDFTFFDPYKKKEMYWEHHGIMDDPAYVNRTMEKIKQYSQNGIFQGENLILTFETKNYPLNLELAQRIIDKYLKYLSC